MYDDAVLWCFITTLDWNIDVQNEYLRLVKIILNHNVEENHDAWYECQRKGQYLYYCKYNVYTIPQYYGKHINLKTVNDDTKCKHLNTFFFNKWVIQNFKISKMLNRESITNSLMSRIKDSPIVDINVIINSRILLLQKCKYNGDYIVKENAVLGIINKIENPIVDGYYIEKVNLSWPTRGKMPSLECSVIVKCETDLLFALYVEENHNKIKNFVHLSDKIPDEKMKDGKELIEKCFCTSEGIHMLINRVTETSTTYNQKDSNSGWRHTLNY